MSGDSCILRFMDLKDFVYKTLTIMVVTSFVSILQSHESIFWQITEAGGNPIAKSQVYPSLFFTQGYSLSIVYWLYS